MIVRLQAPGGSFIGAGKYYLHDKLSEQQAEAARDGERVSTRGQSDERVWFTDTRNCLSTDPERALEEMWCTAEDQAWLKQQAGVTRGGRACVDPVQTLSLSWHKDDKPAPEHIIEAADSYLKHMGWDQHQAVYVAHRDTEHLHLHITLNRVHPETGRTMDNYRDQPRSQAWALAYEREQGQIRCDVRQENAAKRQNRTVDRPHGDHRHQDAPATPQPAMELTPPPKIANDHLPHNVILLARPHEAQFQAEEKVRREHDATAREQLMADQRAEREQFFKDGAKLFKSTRHAVYDDVRCKFREQWATFYKEARLAEQDANAVTDAAIALSKRYAKEGDWSKAVETFLGRDDVHDEMVTHFQKRFTSLKERQTAELRERQKDAYDMLRPVRDVQYTQLLKRQRDDRSTLQTSETLAGIRNGQANSVHHADAAADRDAAANGNQGHSPIALSPVSNDQLMPSAPAESANQAVKELASQSTQSAKSEVAASVLKDLPFSTLEAPEPTRQVADLAAGAIGSAANYLADQLGELFAPTPPEVREVQAKAAAKAEAERPAPEATENPYARQIAAAMRIVESEREQREQNRAYWEERDKDKDFERDR